jgi:hypothetical protein
VSLPSPPPWYLRNCHVVTKMYGWTPLDVIAAELMWLDPVTYREMTGPLAGYWLVENNVTYTFRRVNPEDRDETPGAHHIDIDAELRRRDANRKKRSTP